jgi:hypothetical protein
MTLLNRLPETLGDAPARKIQGGRTREIGNNATINNGSFGTNDQFGHTIKLA